MKLTKQFESKISEFFQLMQSGKDAWVSAGKLLVEMVAENDNTYEILISRNQNLRADTLELLERIGRKPIVADLILSDSYTARKVLDLSDKDLEKATTTHIPVVTTTELGVPKVEHKRIDEMTRTETDQVFSDGKIRTPDEQLESLKEKAKAKAARDLRYWVHDGKVTFRERSTFGLGELEDLLHRLQKEITQTLEGEMKKRQVGK